MKTLPLLHLLGLVGLVAAGAQNCSFDSITPSKNLVWCPCEDGFFCAKLDVPLNPKNPNPAHRASIPLIKYPSSPSPLGPYRGILLLNPGGPGDSGLDLVRTSGPDIQTVAGANWDLVGFDPRGVGLYEPSSNCSSDGAALTASNAGKRGVPVLEDEYYTAFLDYYGRFGRVCEKTIGGEGDIGPYMSTADTARDMLSVVNAFAKTPDGKRASKPSHLLNFYGISYGTYLGQTFASLFPDRVGNMVLDGVVSPEVNLHSYIPKDIKYTDGILALFFIYCHEAGPSSCAFDTGSSPKDVYARFYNSFSQLDPHKAKAQNWANETALENALLTLKQGLLGTAYNPTFDFAAIVSILVDLEAAVKAQDIQPWIDEAQTLFGNPNTDSPGLAGKQQNLGVLCSDNGGVNYGKTLHDLRPVIDALEKESIVGEVWVNALLGCARWPIKAKNRFAGPFGGKTTTPIVFVSNTYDPVTPIDNSFSFAPKFKNAQILTVEGSGHASGSSLNECSFAKLQAYLQETKMPGCHAYCPLEVGAFNITLNGTLKENIERSGLSNLLQIS